MKEITVILEGGFDWQPIVIAAVGLTGVFAGYLVSWLIRRDETKSQTRAAYVQRVVEYRQKSTTDFRTALHEFISGWRMFNEKYADSLDSVSTAVHSLQDQASAMSNEIYFVDSGEVLVAMSAMLSEFNEQTLALTELLNSNRSKKLTDDEKKKSVKEFNYGPEPNLVDPLYRAIESYILAADQHRS